MSYKTMIYSRWHYAIVGIILLLNCVSCSKWNVRNEGAPVIQFAEYQFYEYDQDKANQNGIELWAEGVYAIDEDTIFLFGNVAIANVIDIHRSLLLRSTDGGKHWQEVEIKPEHNESILAVAFVNNGIGWALAAMDVEGFAASGLYRSSDYGKTWNYITRINNGLRPWGMKFSDENHGYIKFDSIYSGLHDHFGILTTTDGGLTWEETFSFPLPIARDDTEEFKKATVEFSEPMGGDYGSYWNNYWHNYWKTDPSSNILFAKGHDHSEWKLYSDKTSAEYTIAWHSAASNAWTVTSTIPTHFQYTNGHVTSP